MDERRLLKLMMLVQQVIEHANTLGDAYVKEEQLTYDQGKLMQKECIGAALIATAFGSFLSTGLDREGKPMDVDGGFETMRNWVELGHQKTTGVPSRNVHVH